MAQRVLGHVLLPAEPAPAAAGEGMDPRRRQNGAVRLRHRDPLHELQSLGPAAVLGADGDLFKAIREKRASVVTQQIDAFTKNGIRLKDGSELEADIIVTATGLNLQVLGGMEVSVDGRAIDFAER